MGAGPRGALVAAGVAFLGMIVGSMLGVIVSRAVLMSPEGTAGVMIPLVVAGVAVGAAVGVRRARRGITDRGRTMLWGGGGAAVPWVLFLLFDLAGSSVGEVLVSLLYGAAGVVIGTLLGAVRPREESAV